MRISDWSSDVCSSDLVEVYFRIAFVRGNDKIVLVGQGKQRFPFGERHDVAGGVARRAYEYQLGFGPDVRRHTAPVVAEAQVGPRIDVIRRGAAKQGRAFIDLIERVGAEDRKSTRLNSRH